MRFKEIMEVAVHRDDPAMNDYDDDYIKQSQDMKDAPYYVAWYAQSYEWYGDGDPADGNGRYKPKGDGGRIVAINIPTYDKALEISRKLEASYESGEFEDKNVYGKHGEDGYVLEYHGTGIRSMAKMDDFDRDTIANIHSNFKPADYEGTHG